ncbi:hypothetical protein [Streptomyces sp. OspMP-M43]|uniref:hypothetical protein n=1 Tax=Streptomyces sp. OspMP-M43 TaxID=1839781 RepID=UPI00081B934D|nr:hypothetical protein [Streptomyces sp. OspMP-M43]SCE62772.1 hypothetical protein GA0115261_114731 [Streptomyces sp. OspMP-M43]
MTRLPRTARAAVLVAGRAPLAVTTPSAAAGAASAYITDNAVGGINVMRTPQGPVCPDAMNGDTGGDTVGAYGGSYDPTGVRP